MEVFAAETESVYRSERIFKEQEKLTSILVKSELPSDGKNILQACEELKAYLVQCETGIPEIRNSGSTLITDGSAGEYLSRSPEIEKKLVALNLEINRYNQSLSVKQQKIEGISKLDDRRVSQAINDLIQAQMVILQNQSAIALNN
jgi:hypothetical protein